MRASGRGGTSATPAAIPIMFFSSPGTTSRITCCRDLPRYVRWQGLSSRSSCSIRLVRSRGKGANTITCRRTPTTPASRCGEYLPIEATLEGGGVAVDRLLVEGLRHQHHPDWQPIYH